MNVLQFSGGADSLATLWQIADRWKETVVLWVNTGAAYGDTIELMYKVAKTVPHFHEVRADKPAWEAENGVAVDVVPENETMIAQVINGSAAQRYTSWIRCCSANIWHTLDQESRQFDPKIIYRGQRATDKKKAPIKSGHVDATGIEYQFPIEGWSRDEVMGYVMMSCPDWFPQYYLQGEESSHDCWDCIAYLDDNVQRIKNLPAPKREVVMHRLARYNEVLRRELAPLKELL